jgi:hypothetical protein
MTFADTALPQVSGTDNYKGSGLTDILPDQGSSALADGVHLTNSDGAALTIGWVPADWTIHR